MLLLLDTSTWGLSNLWGVGVPTSDIDHSRPRLRCLLLRSLLIRRAPTSPPDVRCPAYQVVAFCPGSAQDHPNTRASPVYLPEYQKTFARLYLTRHFQIPTPPLLPRPHHTWQIPVAEAPIFPPKYFYCVFQLLLRSRLLSPWILTPPPSLVYHLLHKILGDRL